MLVDFILIGILIGYLKRGNLTNLSRVHLSYWWLILVGFGVKFAGLYGGGPFAAWLNWVGMGLVFLGTVLNWRVPGMKLISLGSLANLLVIFANQGKMPVYLPLADRLGLSSLVERLQSGAFPDYTPLSSFSRLVFLGDVLPYFSLIARQPFVISLGDYFIGFGVMVFILRGMTNPWVFETASSAEERREADGGL
ncbi:MAG: hypothetical protein PWP04_421 [Candidatus Atribacteria bacterium]|nr:hypothetical protein [Candidatus Atribacteria bacterium]